MGTYQYVFHLVKRTDVILWLHLGYAAIVVASLTLASFTWGIAGAPWAVLAATILFNMARYSVATRHIFLPMAGGIVIKTVTLAAATFLLAYFSQNWNVGLRIAITLFAVIALGAYSLRLKWHLVDQAVSLV